MSEKHKSVRDQANEYRKKVAESFLHLLDADNPVNSFDWVKGWQSLEMPYSITSDVKYSGINAYHLFLQRLLMSGKIHDGLLLMDSKNILVHMLIKENMVLKLSIGWLQIKRKSRGKKANGSHLRKCTTW